MAPAKFGIKGFRSLILVITSTQLPELISALFSGISDYARMSYRGNGITA